MLGELLALKRSREAKPTLKSSLAHIVVSSFFEGNHLALRFGRAMLVWWIQNKETLKNQGRLVCKKAPCPSFPAAPLRVPRTQHFENTVKANQNSSEAHLMLNIMSHRSQHTGFGFDEAK